MKYIGHVFAHEIAYELDVYTRINWKHGIVIVVIIKKQKQKQNLYLLKANSHVNYIVLFNLFC